MCFELQSDLLTNQIRESNSAVVSAQYGQLQNQPKPLQHLYYLFLSLQGLWYTPVCGKRSASHGCSGVCPHDNFPQQGADRRESDTEGGQPVERGHCAATKVMVPSSGYVLSHHSEFPTQQGTHGLEDFSLLNFSFLRDIFPLWQFCDGVYFLDMTEWGE